MIDLQIKDYVLIKDSFNIQHVVRVDAIMPTKSGQAYASSIIKSIDKSDLNTTIFYDDDIQLVLGQINMNTLEVDYPEIFL